MHFPISHLCLFRAPSQPGWNFWVSCSFTNLAVPQLSFVWCLRAGYWAFGFNVSSFVVFSFTAPSGMIAALYVFAVLQIIGCYQIYCRPTFGFAYNYVLRKHERVWSFHNVLMRAIVTTIYMAIITLIAAMVPFFG